MNILEMREAIQLNIDDTSGDLHDKNQLNNILIRAYNHIYRKVIGANDSPTTVSVSLTFSANVRELFIFDNTTTAISPSNLQRAIFCRDANGFEIPILDFEASLKSQQPSVYARRSVTSDSREVHILGYYVIPTSSFTVTLDYIPKIANSFAGIEDTSTIELVPAEHHDVIVNYATMLALGKDEINSQFWFGMYTESVRDMLATISNAPKKYGGVVDVTDDGEWQ